MQKLVKRSKKRSTNKEINNRARQHKTLVRYTYFMSYVCPARLFPPPAPRLLQFSCITTNVFMPMQIKDPFMLVTKMLT